MLVAEAKQQPSLMILPVCRKLCETFSQNSLRIPLCWILFPRPLDHLLPASATQHSNKRASERPFWSAATCRRSCLRPGKLAALPARSASIPASGLKTPDSRLQTPDSRLPTPDSFHRDRRNIVIPNELVKRHQVFANHPIQLCQLPVYCRRQLVIHLVRLISRNRISACDSLPK